MRSVAFFLPGLIILCLLISSLNIYSQTTISSNVYSNTTWNLAGSPYLVTTGVIVYEGVTLTIDPGVIVKFGSNLHLEVRGKLNAIGTVNDSITFTSSSSAPFAGIWGGIKLVGTTDPLGVGDQLTMRYCKGMYADRFVDLDLAYHGPYIFDHCYFYKNNTVNYDGGLPTTLFRNCSFYNNGTGLDYVQFGGHASHCNFINNTNGVTGFEHIDTCYFYGNTNVALSPYGTATGCHIEHNNIGVQCYFNAVNNTFTNNYVHDNVIGVEAQTYFNGSINFTGNTICNNSTYNFKLSTANNADISNNCWCTTDSTAIRSGIYDGYTPSSSGLVDFLPLNSNCPEMEGMSISEMEDVYIEVIYPNPFHSELNIKTIGSPYKHNIIVFDLSGRQVLPQNIEYNSDRIILNFDEDLKGVYFIRISDSMGSSKLSKVIAY